MNDKFKALLIEKREGNMETNYKEVDLPYLKSDQLLIKMDYAPINPSDLVFIKGRYGISPQYPQIPGFEGSGTVVDTGKNILAKAFKGKRVACSPANRNFGTWSQFMVTRFDKCVPLLPKISNRQGSCLLINPLSAWALMSKVRQNNYKNVIISAASGSIGRMLLKLARHFDLNTIGITSSNLDSFPQEIQENTQLVNWKDPDFKDILKDKIKDKKPFAYLDCTGGEISSKVGSVLPSSSKIINFGSLGPGKFEIKPAKLIFSNLSVEGFWLNRWLKNTSLFHKISSLYRIQNLLPTVLDTRITKVYHLEDFQKGLDYYLQHRSEGKVLLTPDKDLVTTPI